MTDRMPITADDPRVRELVREFEARQGLVDLDLDRFWADQQAAMADPFSPSLSQMAFGAITTGECVYDELGIAEDYLRYEQDEAWRLELHKAYNDIAAKVVGRRLLNETPADPARACPRPGGLHTLFEAEQRWHEGSWWLMPSCHDPDSLRALLDRVEDRLESGTYRDAILPRGWDEARSRLARQGRRTPIYRHQRGPVTFATSIYGTENLLYLILDEPKLAERFSRTIARAMLALARLLDDEAGYTQPAQAAPNRSASAAAIRPAGFSFADDNCALLNPEMYELFGAPVLEAVFSAYAPEAGDRRYQHSDSDMGHHLPTLARLGLNAVNFGPNVMASDIRHHMPHAVIHGVLAPFAYSRNDLPTMLTQLLRDFEMTRASRGLVFATAGSVNNGTRLTSMRLLMAATQRHARF